MDAPTFYLHVLNVDGTTLKYSDGTTVIPMPIDVAGIEFSEIAYVPGQLNMGSCRVQLRDIRDPRYDSLRDVYNRLGYEQRLEIAGSPEANAPRLFTGVLTELPSSLDRLEIVGEGILHRLNTRKLRRYQTISGAVTTSMQNLLKTYDIVFKDDFNRTSGIGANWTFTPGQWDIVNNVLVNLSSGATITSATTFASSVWDNAKLSFDYKPTSLSAPILYFVNPTTGYYLSPIFYADASSTLFSIYIVGGAQLATRSYPVESGEWYHIDIYAAMESGGRRIIVVINGVELFNTLDASGTSTSGQIKIWDTLPGGDQFDNIVLATATNQLTAGTFDTSSTTVSETFNNDTNLTALNWLTEYMDWEYRVNPVAGKGNDTLDMGASLGYDFSPFLTLEEGKNIVDLSRDRMSNDLATSLYVYGQAQDDVTSNYISTDLAAMDIYGIVEKDYSDPRVVDVGIAKTLGDNRLSIVSAGNVSISGRVLDESALLGQLPVWGSVTWGDFIWGGRTHFRAGDYVQLKSPTLNINKKARIVQITRASGDPSVKLTFDYFPRRQTGQLQWVHGMYEIQRRTFIQRMNTQNVRLALSGTTAQSWYVYLRGQIVSVYIDIRSASWAGAVTVAIDGVDRTNALFGAATITADAHANDTSYLVLSGNHYLTFTPTLTVTLDVSISAKVLS